MEADAYQRKGREGRAFSNNEFIKEEKYYRALACRTRLKILAALEDRPMFGHELVKRLGMGQSTVSYHLGILRRAGLVKTDPQSSSTRFSLLRP